MIQSPAGYQGDVRIKRYLDFYQAGYGVAMLSSGVAFSPLSLFANGEQGGWYDPSDLTTLFQDAAGTTPVTAVEQPVGLVLDKSKGLVLGSELVTNGNFATDTNWTKEGGWSITGGQALFNGPANRGLIQNIGLTANVVGKVTIVVASVTTGGLTIQFGYNTGTATITAPGTYTYTLSAGAFPSIYIVSVGTSQFAISSVSVKLVAGSHLSQSTSTARPVLSARVNLLLNTATLATQSVTTVATTYTLAFSGAGSITLSGTATGTYSAGSNSITCTAGTLTLTVSGTVTNADLRPANAGVGLPSYQRVTTATDYDTTGFPLYLKFDGVDDALSSANINFTSTNKMSVFAGVRKLSDAAVGCLLELSADLNSNSGTFYVFAPANTGASGDFYASSKGSSGGGATASIYAALSPTNGVLTYTADIAGPLSKLVVNGFAGSTNTTSQGSGNYGNYPLFVGSRGGTTLPFNGHLYSLIVRGAATDAATIASTETWVNSKTGAY